MCINLFQIVFSPYIFVYPHILANIQNDFVHILDFNLSSKFSITHKKRLFCLFFHLQTHRISLFFDKQTIRNMFRMIPEHENPYIFILSILYFKNEIKKRCSRT